MYTGLLHTHNLFRWLVLAAFVAALIFAFAGLTAKKEWKKRDKTAGLILTILMDIQFLTGIILYIFVSPVTKAAFANFGEAMKNANMRFYAVEHLLVMLIALVFVHIGKTRTKKLRESVKKHRNAAIWYGLAFLLVLSRIPWDRAFF